MWFYRKTLATGLEIAHAAAVARDEHDDWIGPFETDDAAFDAAVAGAQ